jgi:hypothetical protein
MSLTGDARARRVDFDDLALLPLRRVTAAPSTVAELDQLIALAGRFIPQLTAAEPAIRRVYRHNPNSIWGVRGTGGDIAGVIALLLLNEAGRAAMLEGELDASDPHTDWLIRPGESAAAVYFWAVALPGFTVEALRAVSLWLRGPAFASADLYMRAATSGGARIGTNLGFENIAELGLYRFRRHWNRSIAADAVA